MHCTLFIIPFFAAFIGWFVLWIILKLLFYPIKPIHFLGFKIQGVFPSKQEQIITQLANFISTSFPLKDIEEKITDSKSIEKMMPFVENQIDHFIRVKLAEKMPIISAFIGEKTIGELKAVFIEEMETLFPELMKNYVVVLEDEIDLETIIAQKINMSSINFEDVIKNELSKEIRVAELIAALIGFILGLIQLAIFLISHK